MFKAINNYKKKNFACHEHYKNVLANFKNSYKLFTRGIAKLLHIKFDAVQRGIVLFLW